MRILILYTGGTIGMIEDPETGALRPFDFDHLIDNVPKVRKLAFEIEHIAFEPIDSSDMAPTHWEQIARAIDENYHRYDGFVVLHGTDTMAYTASALSFMLRGLRKPVIITGSQLPIGEVRTDGEENLITALQIAAETDPLTPQGLPPRPMVQEVAILFENYLWRGNRASKMSADNFNAFRSNNYPALARIGLSIIYNRDALWRPLPGEPDRGLEVSRTPLSRDVTVVYLTPALTREAFVRQLTTPGLRGVVLMTYGAGNAMTAPWFVDSLSEAISSQQLVVVNVSQCVSGSVMPMRYATGRRLAAAGVVSGADMTTEAALTKLMYLLGQNLTPQQTARAMAMPLRGELTQALA